MNQELKEQILRTADTLARGSSTGTVGARDIYYELFPQKRDYRGKSHVKITPLSITRILTANGYTCVETRPHGYSRYKKLP